MYKRILTRARLENERNMSLTASRQIGPRPGSLELTIAYLGTCQPSVVSSQEGFLLSKSIEDKERNVSYLKTYLECASKRRSLKEKKATYLPSPPRILKLLMDGLRDLHKRRKYHHSRFIFQNPFGNRHCGIHFGNRRHVTKSFRSIQ